MGDGGEAVEDCDGELEDLDLDLDLGRRRLNLRVLLENHLEGLKIVSVAIGVMRNGFVVVTYK